MFWDIISLAIFGLMFYMMIKGGGCCGGHIHNMNNGRNNKHSGHRGCCGGHGDDNLNHNEEYQENMHEHHIKNIKDNNEKNN